MVLTRVAGESDEERIRAKQSARPAREAAPKAEPPMRQASQAEIARLVAAGKAKGDPQAEVKAKRIACGHSQATIFENLASKTLKKRLLNVTVAQDHSSNPGVYVKITTAVKPSGNMAETVQHLKRSSLIIARDIFQSGEPIDRLVINHTAVTNDASGKKARMSVVGLAIDRQKASKLNWSSIDAMDPSNVFDLSFGDNALKAVWESDVSEKEFEDVALQARSYGVPVTEFMVIKARAMREWPADITKQRLEIQKQADAFRSSGD
jgi:hypothetical protein